MIMSLVSGLPQSQPASAIASLAPAAPSVQPAASVQPVASEAAVAPIPYNNAASAVFSIAAPFLGVLPAIG